MRFLLGVAAASGAAVFVGGQAWAAESADSRTVSNTETVLSSSLKSVETVTKLSQDSRTNMVVSVPASTSGSGDSVVESGRDEQATQEDKTSMKPTADAVHDGSAVDETSAKTPGLQLATMDQSTANASKDKPAGSIAGEPDISAVTTPASVRVELADAAAVPVSGQLWTSKLAGMAGRPAVNLPLQPTITSQAANVSDLASAMRTIPSRKHDLPPTKSTGLLSQLTMQLAAVVPGLLDLDRVVTWAVSGLVTQVNLVLLSVLVIASAPSFFALWLRRSGFTGAARSDVPSRLIFATSFQLDYASVKHYEHSPFLVVSERKRNS